MRVSVGRVVIVLTLLLLVLLAVVTVRTTLTAPAPGMNDFLSRWEGARAYWQQGLNPYGEQASLQIQEMIFGRPAAIDEDPGYFVYPFYVVFPLWPLVHLGYDWASAVWMVLLIILLVGSVFLILDVFRWRPRPLLLAVIILWMLTNYFSVRALMLGQVGVVVYFFEVLALWALAHRRDGLAGVALALSTLKPQMGYLLIPFLLLWAFRARRWPVIVGFGAALALLMGASFLLQPSWLVDWLDQMRLYPQYTARAYPDTGSPVWIVVQHYLGLGEGAVRVVDVLFYGLLAWAWYDVLLRGRSERADWALMLTLVITHLVALRTATTHFVVFYIPLIFYLRELARGIHGRAWLVGGVLLALFILPWAQFLITVQGRDTLEHPSLFLPPTFGLLALLWLTRRRWWAEPAVILDAPSTTAEPAAREVTA